jgi:hypothetical protein
MEENMSTTEHLNNALLLVLEETFENVHGIYLDKNTSIFETLAAISAEQASIPTSPSCASIAAHVEHMAFYNETILQFVRGERPEVDWDEIWHRVEAVTPAEWEASQQRLRASYQEIRTLFKSTPDWKSSDEIGGALGLIAHNAYHLGEIRQALCAIKS